MNYASKIIRKTIKKAYENWEPSPLIRCYHSCAAFDGKKMLGFARNNPIKMNRKAHRIGQQFNIPTYVEHSYPHAESHLVSQLLDRYNVIDPSWSIVVLRINKLGLMLGSKPCDNCAKILSAVGLNDVYWSVLNNVFQSDDRQITIDHDYFCKYAKGIYLDENNSELLNV
jgi:hypothetical protein